MAAVISAQIVEGAAREGAFEAGRELHDTGKVSGLESVDFGARGFVADNDTAHDVWVGIRYQFLVGECDCPDAAQETTTDDYLQAAEDDEADPPELCAHAVAVALSAIAARLPWASAPAGHRPRYSRAPEHTTTPPPPLDITTVFPALSALAATTIRLHPRGGRPRMRDSSLGGPLLWPAREPWPTCTQPHAHEKKIQAPSHVTSMAEAVLWGATQSFRPGAYTRTGDGPIYAVVSDPRPPDHPSPLIAIMQLYARDVPELPFPDGTDVLQLLWCPNQHDGPWFGPWPSVFWRREADVAEVLADPPEPIFDDDGNAEDFDPIPCVLRPERVTEYPHPYDLPDNLRERMEEWDEETSGLYWSGLSTAPGTKALGHPRWIQGNRWPSCEKAHRMQHLVTIATLEQNAGKRWVPTGDPGEWWESGGGPHGMTVLPPRPDSAMYIFACTICPDRPVNGESQSMN